MHFVANSRRIVAWILIFHCAHIPIPVTDGVEPTFVSGCLSEERFDIDFVLLGVDPPDDVDDGPIDDDPEHDPTCFGGFFVLQKDSPTVPHRVIAQSRRWVGGHLANVNRASLVGLQQTTCPPFRRFCDTFTLVSPQGWRESLSVLLL